MAVSFYQKAPLLMVVNEDYEARTNTVQMPQFGNYNKQFNMATGFPFRRKLLENKPQHRSAYLKISNTVATLIVGKSS